MLLLMEWMYFYARFHAHVGFNAIRFFFQAACQIMPLDRIKHHRGTVLALRKARETFIVTPDSMQASVFITLDRLTPNSIAFCDYAAPMRHRTDRTRSVIFLLLPGRIFSLSSLPAACPRRLFSGILFLSVACCILEPSVPHLPAGLWTQQQK